MGYLATNIYSVPTSGYRWYVFFLDDRWQDDVRNELNINFENMAHEVGPEILVVKGTEKGHLYNSILDSEILSQKLNVYPRKKYPLPAILVSNKPFSVLDDSNRETKNSKIILFPISEHYVKPGSVTSFLIDLARTLKESDSIEIENPSKWRWLTDYLDLKPNFFGFGLNLNNILEDLFGVGN